MLEYTEGRSEKVTSQIWDIHSLQKSQPQSLDKSNEQEIAETNVIQIYS